MALGEKIWRSLIKSLISIKGSIAAETQKIKTKIGPAWTKFVAIFGGIVAVCTVVAAICTTLDYFNIHPYVSADEANMTNDSSAVDNDHNESGPEDGDDDNFSDNYLQSPQITNQPQSTDIDEGENRDDDDVDNNGYDENSVDIAAENEKKSTVSNVTNVISTPSDEIVKNHQEFILQQKAKYTESHIINIENTFVNFLVWEKAAEISYILEETDRMISESVGGRFVPSATIIIIDYETDEVIYTLITDEDGDATYHPVDLRMFYCVAVTFDYQMFVSPPVRLIDTGHSEPNFIELFLDKPYSLYTQDFQIQVSARDRSKTILNHSLWANQMADVKCVAYGYEDYEDFKSSTYGFDTNSSGIISIGENPCYFSLNTQYVFYVSLERWDTSYEMIDGSLKNTDIIEVYLEYTE